MAKRPRDDDGDAAAEAEAARLEALVVANYGDMAIVPNELWVIMGRQLLATGTVAEQRAVYHLARVNHRFHAVFGRDFVLGPVRNAFGALVQSLRTWDARQPLPDTTHGALDTIHTALMPGLGASLWAYFVDTELAPPTMANLADTAFAPLATWPWGWPNELEMARQWMRGAYRVAPDENRPWHMRWLQSAPADWNVAVWVREFGATSTGLAGLTRLALWAWAARTGTDLDVVIGWLMVAVRLPYTGFGLSVRPIQPAVTETLEALLWRRKLGLPFPAAGYMSAPLVANPLPLVQPYGLNMHLLELWIVHHGNMRGSLWSYPLLCYWFSAGDPRRGLTRHDWAWATSVSLGSNRFEVWRPRGQPPPVLATLADLVTALWTWDRQRVVHAPDGPFLPAWLTALAAFVGVDLV